MRPSIFGVQASPPLGSPKPPSSTILSGIVKCWPKHRDRRLTAPFHVEDTDVRAVRLIYKGLALAVLTL